MKFRDAASLFAFLRERKKVYQWFASRPWTALGEATPARQMLLTDLARFCGAYTSHFRSDDPYTRARLEGRREVWLRIMQHVHLEPDELAALYRAVEVGERE